MLSYFIAFFRVFYILLHVRPRSIYADAGERRRADLFSRHAAADKFSAYAAENAAADWFYRHITTENFNKISIF